MKKIVSVLIFAVVFCAWTVSGWAQPYGGPMATDSCDDGSGDPLVATPCQAGGDPEVYEAIQKVFDQAAIAVPGGNLTSNSDTDAFQFTGANSYWEQFTSGDTSNFAAIGITATNTNTLGVFPTGGNLPADFQDVLAPQTGFGYLGDGTMANPFPGGMNPLYNQNFGFALKADPVSGPTTYWSSDPSMNSDGIDHMLVFYLPDLAGAQFYVDLNDDGVWNASDDDIITFSTNTWLIAWEDRVYGHPSFDSDYNDTIFLVTRVNPVPEPMSMVLLGGGLAGLAALRRKKRA